MSLMIWNPFEEMQRLEEEVNRIFGKTRGKKGLALSDRVFSPLTDVKETEDEVIIETNLPGIKKEDLTIEATPECVEIRAESKKESEKKENGKVVYKERYANKYVRRINFPTIVKPSESKTILEDGVLKIVFPKSEEAKPVKLIPN